MRLLLGLLALALPAVLPSPALPNPPNALDAYVAAPDPAFGWRVDHVFSGTVYRGAVLELTSQRWLDDTRVDHPLWRHWLTVIIPEGATRTTGLLYVTGGAASDPAPRGPSPFVAVATRTKTVVSELDDVPNEPLTFAETPKVARTEDGIIAYEEARYARTRDPKDLVRLPMVKSGVAAMTAVQQYLRTSGGPPVDRFTVVGASKRGWTAWLLAAVDPRVCAVVPVVINVLDVDATTRHHWEAMGYFSPALKDYVDNGVIPGMIGGEALTEINRLEDPLNYRDRPAMTMPKFVVNAVGDEYFPPDNTKFGYHLLPEVKRLRMLPNARHSTAGTDILDSITAFYQSVVEGVSLPDYAWRLDQGGVMTVTTTQKPLEASLWRATNPKARDFRVDSIGPAFAKTILTADADGAYRAKVAPPDAGFTAYFVELTFKGPGAQPLKFTTEVVVTPDVLPFAWKDARPVTQPGPR